MVPCPQGIIVDISDEDPQQIPMWLQMVKGSSSELKPKLLLACDVEPFFCQEWLGVATPYLSFGQVSCRALPYFLHIALIGRYGTLGV
jgi:hypothetical protein